MDIRNTHLGSMFIWSLMSWWISVGQTHPKFSRVLIFILVASYQCPGISFLSSFPSLSFYPFGEKAVSDISDGPLPKPKPSFIFSWPLNSEPLVLGSSQIGWSWKRRGASHDAAVVMWCFSMLKSHGMVSDSHPGPPCIYHYSHVTDPGWLKLPVECM